MRERTAGIAVELRQGCRGGAAGSGSVSWVGSGERDEKDGRDLKDVRKPRSAGMTTLLIAVVEAGAGHALTQAARFEKGVFQMLELLSK